MSKHVAVLPGDGIGEEVMAQALRVLEVAAQGAGLRVSVTKGLAGGTAYDKYGVHMPDETLALCQSSDAILFGSVGGPVSEQHLPKWQGCEANSILALRRQFKLNVNFRPVKVLPELHELSPLKSEVVSRGIDILVLRELLGDCYFGMHKTVTENGVRIARDVSEYTEGQVASAADAAFRAARLRRKKVTSVHKANVLDTSKLWRAVVREVHTGFEDVELVDMLVDNAAMQLVKDPSQFDVLLTTNMFGDILSDAAAVLPGSLGLLASASLNSDGFGLFEPPGGSAQDIAGLGIANPIGQILSVALMFRFAFKMDKEATLIESAVEDTLREGYRTRDIHRSSDCESRLVDTQGMADQIVSRVQANFAARTVAAK
jgi:3-isopropylmalate dehydrogenase